MSDAEAPYGGTDVDFRTRLYVFAGVLLLVFLVTIAIWLAGM